MVERPRHLADASLVECESAETRAGEQVEDLALRLESEGRERVRLRVFEPNKRDRVRKNLPVFVVLEHNDRSAKRETR